MCSYVLRGSGELLKRALLQGARERVAQSPLMFSLWVACHPLGALERLRSCSLRQAGFRDMHRRSLGNNEDGKKSKYEYRANSSMCYAPRAASFF